MKHITEILDEAFHIDEDRNMPDVMVIDTKKWRIEMKTINECGYFVCRPRERIRRFTSEQMMSHPTRFLFRFNRDGFQFCVACYTMTADESTETLTFHLKPEIKERLDS
jgi:hypothetical protein